MGDNAPAARGETPPRPRPPVWIFVVVFWLLLSVIYASQVMLMTPRPAERVIRTQLTWQSVYYLAWAPFTLLIWRLTRTWDIEALGWPRFLARHAAAGVVVAVTQALIVIGVALLMLPPLTEPVSMLVSGYIRGRLHMQLLIYAAIVATGQAFGFYNQYRERQVAAARLEAQLSAARLDSLRTQLQPHFLFNSLHSIASLARAGDTAGVVRLISGFSDLLRNLLDSNASHHSVRQELELVDRYLDIQRVRFGDRLRATIDAAPDAAAARVPLLIVQPLVENSLRHGFAPKIEPGRVAISARRDGSSLVIEVEDDGVGLPAGWRLDRGPGTGLRNVASRLQGEYGASHALDVTPVPTGGVRVVVRLPYSRS
jgi:two-component system LytT family sensor kinase